jgi:hypothetical protein
MIAEELGADAKAGEMGAAEVRARIACLQGRHADAAEILAAEPPSALKAWALRKSGRLVEAAACMLEMAPRGSEPSPAIRDVYLELAASEFLGSAGSIEAETTLQFSPGQEGVGR